MYTTQGEVMHTQGWVGMLHRGSYEEHILTDCSPGATTFICASTRGCVKGGET